MALSNHRRIFDMAAHTVREEPLVFDALPIDVAPFSFNEVFRENGSWVRHTRDPAQESPVVHRYLEECQRSICARIDQEMMEAVGDGRQTTFAVPSSPAQEPLTMACIQAMREGVEQAIDRWLRDRQSPIRQAAEENEQRTRDVTTMLADELRDSLRGQYLCETCWDAMTDTVVEAHLSGAGMAMAKCDACRVGGR